MWQAIGKLFENLGFWGALIVVILAIITLALTGIKLGKFELTSVLRHFYDKKDLPIQNDYKYEIEIDDEEKIGFEIPRPNIFIYGKLWNKDHSYIYRLLEERWKDCSVVDLTQCNITSTLISLLENKINKLGAMTIYISNDQVKLLGYLSQDQYKNLVKFEIR